MANKSENEIILEIKVEYEAAIKKIAEYTLKLNKQKEEESALKTAMKNRIEELKKSKADSAEIISVQENYAKKMAESRAEIDYSKRAIQVLTKEVQNNLMVEREKEGSLIQLKASLSNLNAEYERMSELEREATPRGNELQRSIAEITAKLKEKEEALGNHRRSVGDYQKANVSLRKELAEYVKQLQEMKLAGKENTAEFEELSRKAIELTNAINQTNQSINNLRGDISGFQNAILNTVGANSAFGQSLLAMAKAAGSGGNILTVLTTKVKAFTTALIANLIVAIITAVLALLTMLKKGIESNAEATDRFQVLLVPLNMAMEMFEFVLQKVVDLVLTAAEGYMKLAMATSKLLEKLPFVGKYFNPSCSYPLLKSTLSLFPFLKKSYLFTTDFFRMNGAGLYSKAL